MRDHVGAGYVARDRDLADDVALAEFRDLDRSLKSVDQDVGLTRQNDLGRVPSHPGRQLVARPVCSRSLVNASSLISLVRPSEQRMSSRAPISGQTHGWSLLLHRSGTARVGCVNCLTPSAAPRWGTAAQARPTAHPSERADVRSPTDLSTPLTRYRGTPQTSDPEAVSRGPYRRRRLRMTCPHPG